MSLPRPVRLLIVDDIPAVREGLRLLLEDEAAFAVVGEAGDGPAALRLTQELYPDVVLLDIEMPGGDGLTATRLIKALSRPPLVIVMSVYANAETRLAAQRAGADRFIEKTAGHGEVVALLRSLFKSPSS